jgi:hypothetical protein
MNLLKFFIFLFLLTEILAAEHFNYLNLQLHYDIKRDHPTATLEFYGTDNFGFWFFFMDINFDKYRKKGGASDFYFELMRYFNFASINNTNIAFTIQYNDGNEPVTNTWLAGINFNNMLLGPILLSTDFLIKKTYHLRVDWQWTVVWYSEFLNRKLIFNGYFDLWKNDNTNENWPDFSNEVKNTSYSFQAEPQIGWMILPYWKIGSEIEISRGFLGAVTGRLAKEKEYKYNKWYVLPTIFIQYYF